MPKPKRRRRIKRRKKTSKIRIQPQIKRKDENKQEPIPKMEEQLPRSNGIVFKVKMKKK